MPIASFEHVAAAAGRCGNPRACAYAELLHTLNRAAKAQISASLALQEELTEPWVARQLSQLLPYGHGLFVGNSMPVRDMEMYAARRAAAGGGDNYLPSSSSSTEAKGPEGWFTAAAGDAAAGDTDIAHGGIGAVR